MCAIHSFNKFERTFSVDVGNLLYLVMSRIIQQCGHRAKSQHHLDDLFHCSAQTVCDANPTSYQSLCVGGKRKYKNEWINKKLPTYSTTNRINVNILYSIFYHWFQINCRNLSLSKCNFSFTYRPLEFEVGIIYQNALILRISNHNLTAIITAQSRWSIKFMHFTVALVSTLKFYLYNRNAENIAKNFVVDCYPILRVETSGWNVLRLITNHG